jgi:histidinol phosphatase-like PHP family hydrolase
MGGKAARNVPLDNAAIADLLIREAATAEGHREQAFRRAAHAAFLWPEEAADLLATGRSLTELAGIGASLAKRLQGWIEAPPRDLELPPERTEFLTLASARRILARNPAWAARLQADLQMHSEWSDGATPIADLAAAAAARGRRYIAITDHTQGLAIANGLDPKRLIAQGREIAALNREFQKRKVDFTVLHGAEVNLSPEGASDMPSPSLARLEVVLGCFHSALRRREDQTARYLAGIRNPDIQILGHPQTRVWNRREGLHCDWARVFAEAARLDKAVEVDGDPARQDLRISLLKLARKEGCRISIGTDAHHPDEFAYVELSLAATLQAKIPPERIVAFLPLPKFQEWIASVRTNAHV